MANKVNYYKCYSINLCRFLKVNGKFWLSKGINAETGKTFFVFEVDEKLSELLNIWSNNKPKH